MSTRITSHSDYVEALPWNAEKRDLFAGFDPGQSGGITILDEHGAVVLCCKMPETEKDTSDIVAEFAPRIRMAALEAVHAVPGQGVCSVFKFGANYGGLRMALFAHGVPFEDVSPVRWQKDLGCTMRGRAIGTDKTAKKNGTKAKAQQLFPNQKITHAVADSLLLAEYARRNHK